MTPATQDCGPLPSMADVSSDTVTQTTHEATTTAAAIAVGTALTPATRLLGECNINRRFCPFQWTSRVTTLLGSIMYILAIPLYLCTFLCGDYRDTQSDKNGPIESKEIEWKDRRPTVVKYIPSALAIAAAIVSFVWFGFQDRLKDFTYNSEQVTRKLREGIPLIFEEILSQLVKSTRSSPLNVFICGLIIAGPMLVAKDTLEDLADERGCTGKSSRALKDLEKGRGIIERQLAGATTSATNTRNNLPYQAF
ncbi:hypothetical protein L211DRAFT_864986 [Terfezia boudieri ATCC MYA-4762]|uniref:Uncharacterized protein n=1 Tax=Terfezia boudieri ATCC MYA-4762 TaxID=1051890 RepID=A0A3N4LZZ8_9PEZI|nr:hypothetical protein L211DRAFT_864986 [Terfezia boudieri ATCC MYA-4762]